MRCSEHFIDWKRLEWVEKLFQEITKSLGFWKTQKYHESKSFFVSTFKRILFLQTKTLEKLEKSLKICFQSFCWFDNFSAESFSISPLVVESVSRWLLRNKVSSCVCFKVNCESSQNSPQNDLSWSSTKILFNSTKKSKLPTRILKKKLFFRPFSSVYSRNSILESELPSLALRLLSYSWILSDSSLSNWFFTNFIVWDGWLKRTWNSYLVCFV